MYCGSVYVGRACVNAIDFAENNVAPMVAGPVAAAALLVNAQVADIFKGIFEKQKSTQNGKKTQKVARNCVAV